MAIFNQEQTEGTTGFKKEIDEAGISLLLDTVQIYIYQFPIKSSIREQLSNSIDSIIERDIAKILLNDPSRVSEFYVEREGDVYKDSRFDPSYYDPKFLSNDATAYITYKETGNDKLRDIITIRDNGVGLGTNRLEGYFRISYSSKRLSTKTLGTFGLGCKAPLSTGVDFYTLNTAHNGKEFSFLIYKDKIDNMNSKWNADGSVNDFITFSNGYKVYYKKTESKNYAEISWEVKKHQKRDYIDSVKSQLLYFKNPIKFIIDHGHYKEPIEFQAKILHETEDYVLAEQHYYSRPHLIINGVCYGFIEFQELELEQKYGSIGLKLNIDDITVTPSRESLVWDSKTKDSILLKYDNLAKSSEKLINETLSNLSLVEWMSTCGNINSLNYGADADIKVIHNLASLTGYSASNITYKNTGIKYNSSFPSILGTSVLEGIYLQRENTWDKKFNKYVDKLNYSTVNSPNIFAVGKAFIQYGNSNAVRSAYLTEKGSTAILIRPSARSGEDFKKIVAEYVLKQITLEEAIEKLPEMEIIKTTVDAVGKKDKLRQYNKGLQFLTILMDEKVPIYEEVKVPDNYKSPLGVEVEEAVSEEEEENSVGDIASKTDWAALRKQNGKVLIQYPRLEQGPKMVMNKTEMTYTELADCTDTIVYGTKDDLPLLHFLYAVSKENKNNIDYVSPIFRGEPRVCAISQQIVKHFKPFTHVKAYLFGDDEKTLCSEIRRIITARWVSNKLTNKQRYFDKLDEFSPTLKSTFTLIREYIEDHAAVYAWKSCLSKLPSSLQDFITESVEVQTILLEQGMEKAKEYCNEKFGNEDYILVKVFEQDIIDKVIWMLDFDSVFGVLFSEMTSLTDYSKKITPQLAMEIKEIIELKKDRLEQIYPDLCC
jgi:hypothetical protein